MPDVGDRHYRMLHTYLVRNREKLCVALSAVLIVVALTCDSQPGPEPTSNAEPIATPTATLTPTPVPAPTPSVESTETPEETLKGIGQLAIEVNLLKYSLRIQFDDSLITPEHANDWSAMQNCRVLHDNLSDARARGVKDWQVVDLFASNWHISFPDVDFSLYRDYLTKACGLYW